MKLEPLRRRVCDTCNEIISEPSYGNGKLSVKQLVEAGTLKPKGQKRVTIPTLRASPDFV